MLKEEPISLRDFSNWSKCRNRAFLLKDWWITTLIVVENFLILKLSVTGSERHSGLIIVIFSSQDEAFLRLHGSCGMIL